MYFIFNKSPFFRGRNYLPGFRPSNSSSEKRSRPRFCRTVRLTVLYFLYSAHLPFLFNPQLITGQTRNICVGKGVSKMKDSTKQIRVLSVDDHPLLREGLAAIINSQSDMILAGEASSGQEGIEQFFADHAFQDIALNAGRQRASYFRVAV